MATRESSLSRTPDGSVVVALWTSLAGGDIGEALEMPEYGERSIQVEGVFGAGGKLAWEGSNDAVNYHALTDPRGAALEFTKAGLKAVIGACQSSRPRVVGGDGTTSLKVYVVARRATAAARVIPGLPTQTI